MIYPHSERISHKLLARLLVFITIDYLIIFTFNSFLREYINFEIRNYYEPKWKRIMESNQSVYKKLILQKRDSIDFYFDDLEKFKSFTLLAIKNELKIEKERTDSLIQNGEEYVDGSGYLLIKDLFENLSLRSFVVILYSFIEDMLNKLCDPSLVDGDHGLEVRGIKPLTLKYTDMKGKGVKRARLYLEKVIGLNLHTSDQPWSEIDTLRKIRNSIVHEKGKANDEIMKDANIKQHLKNDRLFIFDDVEINSKYLDFILPIVRTFFKEIE